MIFSSFQYIEFFAVILGLIAVLRNNSLKKAVLLGGSYYFYSQWDYRFVTLLFVMTAVSYGVGCKIDRITEDKLRRRWLAAGVTFDLALLGFFKYYGFFVSNMNALLSRMHAEFPLISIILPVGISFITFEVISYMVDIYRGTNRSASTFWDFALLVAFFPHLVAGPILKPREFLPQLQKDIVIRPRNIERGVFLFLFGLIKKVLVADNVAPFVDATFKHPSAYSTGTMWLAVMAYALQIFCDFSGYTDMAIGSATCLGFEIPANFDMPYISRSVTEFWRRWHISLSTWLREYLYIPLGGNRKGKTRQCINLMLTMLLGGLWHGASWNFVIWGGFHGLGLVAHKLYAENVSKGRPATLFTNVVSWLITTLFVCLLWVYFRAATFGAATAIIAKLFMLSNPAGIVWYQSALVVALPCAIIAHWLGVRHKSQLEFRFNTFAGQFVFMFGLFAMLYLSPQTSSPFIYFRF